MPVPTSPSAVLSTNMTSDFEIPGNLSPVLVLPSFALHSFSLQSGYSEKFAGVVTDLFFGIS